jgi:3,4-dihydroxyphenylacetate 2,3-dioxygenase
VVGRVAVARFVGAALCTHIPRLFILDPAARKAYMGDDVTTMYDAMEELYSAKIAALDVDTFIVVDTHWFSTIDYVLNANEDLSGSYTSEELPDMIHDYPYAYRGDPALADWIAEVGGKNNLRVNACHYPTLPIHYPSLTTMRYLNPQGRARVLPVSVCQTAQIHNDLAFGEAIGEAVRTLPDDRRVVFLAAGGMSHRFNPYDVILPKAGANPSNITTTDNREWDERILGLLLAGKHADVLALSPEFKRVATPEGRWAHYLNMVSALGGEAFTVPGQLFGAYEAALGTGQANVWFDLTSAEC